MRNRKKKQTHDDAFSRLDKTDRTARIVAIWLAFLSVFYFFIKLLFL